jgi:putative N-acetyltransferase (TIGR04045 family)
MLECSRPWGAPVRPYTSPVVTFQLASAPWEHHGYWRLRRSVFSVEQGLFVGTDRDKYDDFAFPIVAVSQVLGMPDDVVGAVRIYPVPEDGSCITGTKVWFGGRLAVSRPYRRHGRVGRALINTAVGTARGLGCEEFLASVQQANISYFERAGFELLGESTAYGKPHGLMRARLECFPCVDPDVRMTA